MAKINVENLISEINKSKDRGLLIRKASDLIMASGASDANDLIDGKLGPADSAKIQDMIDNLITKFGEERQFNWRVHILDPIYSIVNTIKIIEPNFKNREYLEDLVVKLVSDLFKKLNPKIPYIPNFLGNFIKSIIINSISPAIIDWIFDKMFGDD